MPAYRTALFALTALVGLQACDDGGQTDDAVVTSTAEGRLDASMSGDSADEREVALVRVVNAVQSSSNLRVRADAQRQLPMVDFQNVSAYTPVDETWAKFEVSDAGGSMFVPLNANREMLIDGHRYTIVVLKNEDGAGYETRVLEDEIENEAGRARLRIVHAAPGAGEVQVRARNGETLFDGVDYGDDDGFKSIAPWTGILDVRTNDGRSLLLSTPSMTLSAGKSYTVVVTRSAAGKLDAFWFEDSQIN